jgi:peptide/nickel transport system permease protein
MIQYIIKRTLLIIPVMLGVSVIVFAIMFLTPGDPAVMMVGENAPPAQVEAIRQRLGLDQPIHIQYTRWLGNVLQLDLGRSIRSNRLVIGEITGRIRPTVELAILATLLAAGVGIPIGVLSATWQNSVVDHVATVLSFIGLAMPVFWQGLMLILLFSVAVDWFPASGRAMDWRHYVLPTLTLGTSAIAAVTRMTRSTMLETINQDFVRTARSKGLIEHRVIYRHALRNALIPVVTIIGLQFGGLLAGAVITETIFAWPGIGRLAVDAMRAKDFPVVQGVVLVFALLYAVVNLLVDITYAFLDPRLKTRYS